MSLVESLHRARKARLKRIAASAVVQAASGPMAGEPASALAAASAAMRRDPTQPAAAPRREADRADERAWAIEILGFADHAHRAPPKLKIEDIQRETARHFAIACNDLLSARKSRDVLGPRRVAMYLAKELTRKSYPDIARHFNRDQTSVLSAVRKLERLLGQDAELADHVERIRTKLCAPQSDLEE